VIAAAPSRQPLREWWREGRGSATVELTVLVPVLVMLLLFVGVVVHRAVEARIRLDDVAHQAARAASLERSAPTAGAAARRTAEAALAAAGVSCASSDVRTDAAGLRPGGAVRVTVTCVVDLGDALLLGVAGRRSLSASALEPVDVYRSFRVDQ
jgi:Flp pilus assembly protein TadG